MAAKTIREFDRSLPMTLLLAREAVMDRFRPSLREHGVTEQQWRVLRALEENGTLDLGELSKVSCLLGPSLTRIIRALEEKAYVTRTSDRGDQRRVNIAITEAGCALINQVGPISEKQYQEIAERVGAENLDALYQNLDDLITALDRP